MENKEKVEWTRLDNASKIFPATSNNRDTKVYRISAELYQNINPSNLQRALDLTLESFPIYRSILRRGFFWYYFETDGVKPKVEIESTHPCAPIYIKGMRNLLFRVSYYNKRINLEIFHALSDGAGAIWFLETLVFHYLKLNHQGDLSENIPSIKHGASISQKMDDSFEKNYVGNLEHIKKQRAKYQRAYKIKGKRLDENKMKVIEGAMSVSDILNISREYNTSITIFLTSLLLHSIYIDMPKKKKKKPVVLSVPVNLRGYYNSSTARNFFSTMNISYNFNKRSSEFKDIVEYVDKEFKRNLTKESIQLKLSKFMNLENNPIARVIPLPLKDLFMKIADKINDSKITTSISNIGRIKTHKEFEKYINQFSICVSARAPKITFCSYGDRLVITFTSPYANTDIQRIFFQFLSDKNVNIEITSNM